MRERRSAREPEQFRAASSELCDSEGANALARSAAAGDPEAMRRLLDMVAPTLNRVVVGVLGGQHPDLDDIIQQSRIALVQGLAGFRGECHAAGYASRIALHEALRARRRSKMRATKLDQLSCLVQGEDGAHRDSEDWMMERRRRVMRDLLEQLPREQAEALGLRVILGWSLDEVATASGAPINTIRSRVRLAKEALRERLEADPGLVDELRATP